MSASKSTLLIASGIVFGFITSTVLFKLSKQDTKESNSKKRTVFIFGDSCTWCYDPSTSQRSIESKRWPVILEKQLNATHKHNQSYNVIVEGLNGRTINEDTYEQFGSDKVNMNGYQQFLPIIHSHKPIDIIIFMLGVNNCKKQFKPTSVLIANQMKKLMELALNSDDIWSNVLNKYIIFISPATINKINDTNKEWDINEKSIEISHDLYKQYQKVEQELNNKYSKTATIKLLDTTTNGVMTGDDSVHLDGDNNLKLANVVYNIL